MDMRILVIFRQNVENLTEVCLDKLSNEWPDLLQRCRTPEPRKVLRGVLGEVPARGGVLGGCLGTPPRAGTSPSTPLRTFGVRGFGTSVAGQATR